MAGSGAASNIENFVYMGMNAFYQSCLTFTSQNYGAGKKDRVDKTLLWCQFYVIATGLLLGNLAYFFGPQLLSIYTPSSEVIAQGLVRLSYIAVPYFLCGVMDVMVGSLRGLGWSVAPMIVSVIGACGLRLLWVAFVFPINRIPACLYFSYPVTWVITGAVHVICFFFIRKKVYAKMDVATANGAAAL